MGKKLVKTKERVGSAGYKSVAVERQRSGSPAAPSTSESNPANISSAEEKKTVVVGVSTQGGNGYQSENLSKDLSQQQAKELSKKLLEDEAARRKKKSEGQTRSVIEQIKKESEPRYDKEKKRYVQGISQSRVEEIVSGRVRSESERRRIAIATGNKKLLPQGRGSSYEESLLRREDVPESLTRSRARRPASVSKVTYSQTTMEAPTEQKEYTGGRLEPAAKPEDFGKEARSKALKWEQKGTSFGTSEGFKAGVQEQFYGTGSLVLGGLAGGYDIVRHPIKTAWGFVQTPTEVVKETIHPEGRLYSFGSELSTNPGFNLGYMGGQAVAIGVGVKGVKRGFAIEKFSVETEGGNVDYYSFGVKNPFRTGRGQSLVTFKTTAETKSFTVKDVPYVSKSEGIGGETLSRKDVVVKNPGRPAFGTPKMDLVENLKADTGAQPEGVKPAGTLETKFWKENLKAVPEEKVVQVEVRGEKRSRAKEAISVGQTLIETTRRTKSKFVQDQLPQKTQRLPEGAPNIFYDTVKQEGGKAHIYGSAAARGSTTAKLSDDFVPHDIDQFIEGGPEYFIALAEKETARLKDEFGLEARPGDKAGSVEVKIDGKWEKVAEKHGPGVIDEDTVPDMVLGYSKEQGKIEIGGVPSTSLSQELGAGVQGVMRVRKNSEGLIDVFPSPKREKDIPKVLWESGTLLESKTIGKGRLEKGIQDFKDLFGQGEEKDLVVADFSPQSPKGKSTSPVKVIVSPNPLRKNAFLVKNASPLSVRSPSRITTSSFSVRSTSPTSSGRSISSSGSPGHSLSGSSSPSGSSSQSGSSGSLPSPSGSPSSPSITGSPMSSPTGSPGRSPSGSPSGSPGGSRSPTSSRYSHMITEEKRQTRTPTFTRGIRGFNVLIRRAGVFHKANREALSKTDALNFGAFKVGHSAAATFRLVSTSEEVKTRFEKKGFMSDFLRTSKHPREMQFIEKPSRRIKSAGELSEITFKGVNSRRGLRI